MTFFPTQPRFPCKGARRSTEPAVKLSAHSPVFRHEKLILIGILLVVAGWAIFRLAVTLVTLD
jgi:hypothetical protein